jgi:hypothetical protein
MANAALFVGWDHPIAGRDQKALRVFSETTKFYAQLQQRGEIESFEAVNLEPHGGDLNGFILIRGDREKLNRLRYSEEFVRLNNRANLVVTGFGVVYGFIGEDLQRVFTDYGKQASDLASS